MGLSLKVMSLSDAAADRVRQIVEGSAKPIIGINANVLMLNAILDAAKLFVPNRPRIMINAVMPITSIKNCTPLGTPKRSRRRNNSF